MTRRARVEISYTPDASCPDSDSFSNTADDGLGHFATATIDVVIQPVNAAFPVDLPSSPVVAEDESLELSGSESLEIDVGKGTIQVVLSVSHGTLTLLDSVEDGLEEDIVGNGFGYAVLTGTQAAIKTSLAETNGLVYQGVLPDTEFVATIRTPSLSHDTGDGDLGPELLATERKAARAAHAARRLCSASRSWFPTLLSWRSLCHVPSRSPFASNFFSRWRAQADPRTVPGNSPCRSAPPSVCSPALPTAVKQVWSPTTTVVVSTRPPERQRRSDKFDHRQRERYPYRAGRSRWEVYPELQHSGRPYRVRQDRAVWEVSRVWAVVAPQVVRRQVACTGCVPVDHRGHHVGKPHIGQQVYVSLDPTGRPG